MLTVLFIIIYCSNIFPGNFAESLEDDVIDLSLLGARLFGKPVENKVENFDDTSGNAEELGPYLEGDLLIPTDARNGMRAESLRWKRGEVPFVIHGSYNAFNMDTIERAMNEYHKKTCIKFIPRRPSDRDYISIESGQSGCWSSVGRLGGKQVVNLQSPGCVTKIGTIIHELLHALGFLHEQNRDERDKFVKINSNNIKIGYESNFAKAKSGETSGYGVAYDFGSVMHYSTKAFSKNNQPTIEAKMNTNDKIGQREGFSSKDVEKINKMYKCQGATGTDVETPQTTARNPNASIFENLINAFFPAGDEEEMVDQKFLQAAG